MANRGVRTTGLFLVAFFLITGAVLLGECLFESFLKQDVNQASMCVASTDQQAMQCKDGQLILARLNPSKPKMSAYKVLNTAALYCNTNHQIVRTQAGVLCVMTHKRIDQMIRRSRAAQQSGNRDSGQ